VWASNENKVGDENPAGSVTDKSPEYRDRMSPAEYVVGKPGEFQRDLRLLGTTSVTEIHSRKTNMMQDF